ncbi:MAG: L-arabinose isomerase [Candidatus Uhrbacteria bacterium GW2011_GWF2_39_13]|uniref:L-arabinose isomerase n=1 Tax=Candidatus Uhrbacteria bacterium GW2011_GWF2_39_13 TaxID=1618995 RepID=A0A0G0QRX7_9BACT|nr:MAG: L-arabinose isomerase [Candidatus Uhrbacteria bacterium GW2011_GWF2_39_13]
MSKPKITSFEASNAQSFGDIISSNHKNNNIKVGLLGCGYFEYWRMYPALEKKVAGDLRKIQKRLSSFCDLVYPCMVDTLDAAELAGNKFVQEKIDLIVIAEGTYLPDFIVLHVLDKIRHVPVIFFNTQTGADVSPFDDYPATMRNSALIGLSQLSGTFRKTDRKYDVVVGEISDENAYSILKKHIQSVRIAKKLTSYNIGIIGHVFRGMYDLEYDRSKIRGFLGPEIISIQMEHLIDIWKSVSEKTAKAEAAKLFARFKSKHVTIDDAVRSVRLGLAMKEIVRKFNLDALCFLGQHYIEKVTGAPARLGASILMEKENITVACEGDIGGLIMMEMMKDLTGNIPLQAEWGQFDKKNNAIFLLGHGIATPEMASSDKSVTLTRSPEEWGFKGNGINYELIMKPGPVTMGHFLHTANGWRMFISEGEAIEFPCLPCDEIHAMIKVETPVESYIRNVLETGTAHHVIVVQFTVPYRKNYRSYPIE